MLHNKALTKKICSIHIRLGINFKSLSLLQMHPKISCSVCVKASIFSLIFVILSGTLVDTLASHTNIRLS